MIDKPTHGGARDGAGKPPKPKELKRVRISPNIAPETVEKIAKITNSTKLSAGKIIDQAILLYYNTILKK